MQLRLLVFAPPAVLITAVILVAASSFVSALETSFTPKTMNAVKIQRYASDCDVLYWAIHEISRSATNCDADLQCLDSPILCPITMGREKELEYQSLRTEFGRRCGVSHRLKLPSGLTDVARSGPDAESATCGSAFEWSKSDASDRSIQPDTFVF
jgi:hypothetical protein